MIDYHAHVAALAVLPDALDAATASTPHAAEWQSIRADVKAEPGCALLGTLLDHLLERSEGAKREQHLLEEASSLYGEAIRVLSRVAPLAESFQRMVAAPGSATLEQFSALRAELEQLQATLTNTTMRFRVYQGTVLPPYRHVQGHAIANEEPVSQWLWRDVVLSRRTDALVRALREKGRASAPNVREFPG